MKRAPSPLEILLLIGLAIGAGLHLLARPDYSKRNFEFMPDMAETPGYEAQDPNPNFPDGKTLQAPVPGTVTRGYMPLMDETGHLDTESEWEKMPAAERARWDALKAPYTLAKLTAEAQAALLARGKHVFVNVCAACHGPTGRGGTPVTKRGVPPPPTLFDAKYRDYSDGHLLHVITMGKGNMAPHANHVTRDDRWKVIHFIRTLLPPKP